MSNVVEVKEKEVGTSVVLTEELLAWLKAEAEREDRSVSSLVRSIIALYRKQQYVGVPPRLEVGK